MLDAGYWELGAGCWVLGAELRLNSHLNKNPSDFGREKL